MALTKLSANSCCISVAASAVLIILLGSSLDAYGHPLVYPNRFSFQKTSTTSTTEMPLHDHDHSNNSVSTFGNAIATESGLPSSYAGSIRYDIAAWVIGALLLVGLLFVILYPRRRRINDISLANSSCYVFPADSNTNLKSDMDAPSITRNTTTS